MICSFSLIYGFCKTRGRWLLILQRITFFSNLFFVAEFRRINISYVKGVNGNLAFGRVAFLDR